MRRTSTCLAVAGLAVLALLAVRWIAASALPSVKFKSSAVPIPGFPHTGNILGAGTAFEGRIQDRGHRIPRAPRRRRCIGVNFYLPSGSKSCIPPSFPTCTKSTLEQPSGPRSKRPTGSAAGPTGTVLGSRDLRRRTRAKRPRNHPPFYAPGGGFEVLHRRPLAGVARKSFRPGHYKNFDGGGGYGPELIEAVVPLVASVPGAPYASVEDDQASRPALGDTSQNGKTTYYGTLSRRNVRRGGFPLKTEVIVRAKWRRT